jgi:hypothetical protein
MKALVFYTSTDRKGKKDATGAFIPEAEAFQKLWNVPEVNMRAISHQLSVNQRRFSFESLCRNSIPGEFDAVVYFGHGTTRGLPGLGYQLWNDGHDRMAEHLAIPLKRKGRVALYACLAGKGFGFADRLAFSLRYRAPDAEVISHLTAGHTSWNPWAEYSGRGPRHTGQDVISRKDALWSAWVERLRNDQPFRLWFPFVDVSQIRTALGEVDVPPGPSMLIPERP